jgi:hypothetical protein
MFFHLLYKYTIFKKPQQIPSNELVENSKILVGKGRDLSLHII